jgi:hypothetical protein
MDKAESNRKNAQRSTGPRDTSSTRFNAVTHGLLAQGLTELDDSDAYKSLLQRLTEEFCPVGDLEKFLVQYIALNMIRLPRAGRFEAEFITEELHPPKKEDVFPDLSELTRIVEPGLPAAVGARSAMILVTAYQRYETAIENKLYRAINQLERLQRTRRGEFVPPPNTLDVSINSAPDRDA